ncbi:MAG: molybdopterin-guanine dinucleotide biosynthesis protein B [Thermoplasmata archaeon M9B1D]|nr:MAG: molybdopterin-guanine dinucleotide biosynthesis protein B [Thermoplasmata archaeon M9B1D]
MKKPKILGFYGESKSGKTTLITKLIKHLSADGLNVATVKITDKNIKLDSKEKDTWKHSEAGSNLVVLSSATETDYLIKKKQTINDIIKNMLNIGHFDIILIEGANDKETPKIRLGKIKQRVNTVFTYDGDFEKLLDFVKNQID